MEALEKQLRPLQLDAGTKEKQFIEAKQKIIQLAKEKAEAEAQYRKTLYALIACAEKECLELCTMMYKRLPRELRNMVYQYLYVEERSIPIGPYFHFRKIGEGEKPKWVPANLPFGFGDIAEESDKVNEDREGNEDSESGGKNSSSTGNHWADKAAKGAQQLDVLAHNVSADFRRAIYPLTDSDTDSDSDAECNSSGKAPTAMKDGRIRYDHTSRPPSDMLLPSNWVFKPKYVGGHVALELLDIYYSSNNFSVCNMEQASKFLKHHRGRSYHRALKCRPINHIRHLQIRIKAEHFPHHSYEEDTDPGLANELFCTERRFLESIVSSLRDLWCLIHKAKSQELHMELILMTDSSFAPPREGVSHDEKFNLLQAVRNFVYKAKYERENTTVRITHHDDALWPFPKNYTDMFGLTKEQWEHEKAVQGNKADWHWANSFWLAPRLLAYYPKYTKGLIDESDMVTLSRMRWGLSSPNATRCTLSIEESDLWPLNNYVWGSEHSVPTKESSARPPSTSVWGSR